MSQRTSRAATGRPAWRVAEWPERWGSARLLHEWLEIAPDSQLRRPGSRPGGPHAHASGAARDIGDWCRRPPGARHHPSGGVAAVKKHVCNESRLDLPPRVRRARQQARAAALLEPARRKRAGQCCMFASKNCARRASTLFCSHYSVTVVLEPARSYRGLAHAGRLCDKRSTYRKIRHASDWAQEKDQIGSFWRCLRFNCCSTRAEPEGPCSHDLISCLALRVALVLRHPSVKRISGRTLQLDSSSSSG